MNDEQQLAIAERMDGFIFKYLSEHFANDELVELHNRASSYNNNWELHSRLLVAVSTSSSYPMEVKSG